MDIPSPNHANNPFLEIAANLPLVAVTGLRNGYIMLATAAEITTYTDLPDALLMAAKDWAATLEQSGSPRVYWITLSEVTRHLHIHLFPRWPEDALKGVDLFSTRQTHPQPDWTTAQINQLKNWANHHGVTIG